MCEYGFEEEKDYFSILRNRSDGLPGKGLTDHELTIDMAKQLCMIQRTDIGRQFREYFIKVEEAWNTPEAVMARALQFANRTIDTLKQRNFQLEETVAEQKKEIEHKEDVIVGLVEDIDLATKRQRINQIVRYHARNTEGLTKRWNLLYDEFEKKYHVNLSVRLENYKNTYKPKLKNRIDVIDRQMEMIPQLYEICCKLYENDVKILMQEWEGTIVA